VARAAGVGRLVLTHVPPWHDPAVALDEAEATYDGPVELARPGVVYEL
jgi:ribonuclease BN (tRNA processing enzyme)